MYTADIQKQKIRDQERQAECTKKGITLIEIPYWWNNNEGFSYSFFF